MGNRVNDKEQAVESILVLYGTQLADTPEDAKVAMKILSVRRSFGIAGR
ncbi:hypothetical protein SPAR136_1561 [Streptococcus pneumoniae EU-NP01]|nr:hypothetical protein SPAR136_1561 [Streptococcus pneumoniae EU-NP01]